MTFDYSLIAILGILFLSTFVRSAFGFGDAILAMPLLAFFIDLKTASPLVALVAISIALSILLKNWKILELRNTSHLIVSSILSIPLGVYYLKNVNEALLKGILGLLILSFSLYQIISPKQLKLKNSAFGYLFGFIAGLFGGAYNTNGPFIVVYGSLKHWSKESFRVTLQAYFFFTGMMVILSHLLAGNMNKEVVSTWLISLPVIFIAIFLGGKLHYSLNRNRFNTFIYSLLILIGMSLIYISYKA